MRKHALVYRTKLFSMLGLVIIGLFVLFEVLVGRRLEDAPSEAASLDFRLQFAAEAFLIALAILLLAVLEFPRLLRHVRPGALEVGITLMMSAALCVAILSSPIYINKFRRRDCLTDYKDPQHCTNCDTNTVLIINGFVAVAHIGLPIRWHILLMLQAISVALYAAVVLVPAFGEVRTERVEQVIFLTGLVLVSSLGKRSTELVERRAFMEIIDERTRRCQAEFRLSLVEGVGAGRHSKDPVADNVSLPTTTATGNVFNAMHSTAGSIQDRLSEIASLVDAEHWRIRASELRLLPGHPLGKGGFGVVCRAAFCGTAVAVKMPLGHRVNDGAAQKLPELCNELRVLRRLKHPNIVTVLGVVIDPARARFLLVLDLVRGKPLGKFLKEAHIGLPTGGADATRRYQVMSGICRALLYMHTREPPVVHGDLKPSNIMVEVTLPTYAARPVLLDFGLSRVLAASARPLGQTLSWTAPEGVHSQEPLRCSADVYTAGLLLAFVAADVKPAPNMTQHEILTAIEMGTMPPPILPPGCAFTSALQPLVDRCLVADASTRPPMSELHEVLVAVPEALGFQESNEAFPLMGPSLAEGTGDGDTGLPPQPAEQPASGGGLAAPRPPGDGAAAEAQVVFTKNESMLLTMLEVISRWRVPPHNNCCCAFHRDVQAAQSVISFLMRMPCKPDGVMNTNGRQCSDCGILGLDAEDQACQVCAHVLAKKDCVAL